MRLFLLLTGTFLSVSAAVSAAPGAILKQSDRIVFVGNTFFERAQRFGHIESLIDLAAGAETTGLSFRNLGWSGDSVFADARSYFGKPQEGRDRLKNGIAELKPNVLIVCYGTGAAMSTQQGWTDDSTGSNRSAAGDEESLALFVEQYGKLIDLMQGAAGEGLRETVLMSPPPLENLGPPFPDQTGNNRRLAKFRDAIGKLASERNLRFIDLFGALRGDSAGAGKTELALTDNGVHYGEAGYRQIGAAMVEGLGLQLPEGLIGTDETVEKLRGKVVKKNRLFFHQWRPANETYLFLFRKHEQGQNAKEIPMFDPLIAAEEKAIGELKAEIFRNLKKR